MIISQNNPVMNLLGNETKSTVGKEGLEEEIEDLSLLQSASKESVIGEVIDLSPVNDRSKAG